MPMTAEGSQRTATSKMLVFQLGSQPYAIDAAAVDRLTPAAELHAPPALPELLLGFLNLAGNPIAVVCPHVLFNLPRPAVSLWTPFLILRSCAGAVALVVDRVSRIRPYRREEVLPLPPTASINACLLGVVRWERESILMLSPDRILLEHEARCIESLARLERDRLASLRGIPS
jgi:purine-binding chemotaxis protein CheW